MTIACQLDGNGMQEVGLAQSDAAVDEERVIEISRSLRDGLRHGMCQSVVAADDEIVEGMARIDIRTRRAAALPVTRQPVLSWCNGLHDDLLTLFVERHRSRIDCVRHRSRLHAEIDVDR